LVGARSAPTAAMYEKRKYKPPTNRCGLYLRFRTSRPAAFGGTIERPHFFVVFVSFVAETETSFVSVSSFLL